MERDNFVTEKVKNAFSTKHRYHTLMQVFQQHNEDYAKQVEAGMKSQRTLEVIKDCYGTTLQSFSSDRVRVKTWSR